MSDNRSHRHKRDGPELDSSPHSDAQTSVRLNKLIEMWSSHMRVLRVG